MRVIAATEAKEAYDSWHERLEVHTEADAPWHRLVKLNLAPETDLAGARVLEIGCGRGGFSCWLARNAPSMVELVAADFSDAAVRKGQEHAQRLGLTGITWTVADIQNLSFPDKSFRTVISCETIEHVPDPAQAIRELARVLMPGGRLFLTTPNYLGTLGLYRVYLRLRGRRFTECGQPINNFTLLPRTRNWVVRAGLKVLNLDAIGHYLPFPRRPPIHFPLLDNPRLLMKWFAHHSFVLARKP